MKILKTFFDSSLEEKRKYDAELNAFRSYFNNSNKFELLNTDEIVNILKNKKLDLLYSDIELIALPNNAKSLYELQRDYNLNISSNNPFKNKPELWFKLCFSFLERSISPLMMNSGFISKDSKDNATLGFERLIDSIIREEHLEPSLKYDFNRLKNTLNSSSKVNKISTYAFNKAVKEFMSIKRNPKNRSPQSVNLYKSIYKNNTLIEHLINEYEKLNKNKDKKIKDAYKKDLIMNPDNDIFIPQSWQITNDINISIMRYYEHGKVINRKIQKYKRKIVHDLSEQASLAYSFLWFEVDITDEYGRKIDDPDIIQSRQWQILDKLSNLPFKPTSVVFTEHSVHIFIAFDRFVPAHTYQCLILAVQFLFEQATNEKTDASCINSNRLVRLPLFMQSTNHGKEKMTIPIQWDNHLTNADKFIHYISILINKQRYDFNEFLKQRNLPNQILIYKERILISTYNNTSDQIRKEHQLLIENRNKLLYAASQKAVHQAHNNNIHTLQNLINNYQLIFQHYPIISQKSWIFAEIQKEKNNDYFLNLARQYPYYLEYQFKIEDLQDIKYDFNSQILQLESDNIEYNDYDLSALYFQKEIQQVYRFWQYPRQLHPILTDHPDIINYSQLYEKINNYILTQYHPYNIYQINYQNPILVPNMKIAPFNYYQYQKQQTEEYKRLNEYFGESLLKKNQSISTETNVSTQTNTSDTFIQSNFKSNSQSNITNEINITSKASITSVFKTNTSINSNTDWKQYREDNYQLMLDHPINESIIKDDTSTIIPLLLESDISAIRSFLNITPINKKMSKKDAWHLLLDVFGNLIAKSLGYDNSKCHTSKFYKDNHPSLGLYTNKETFDGIDYPIQRIYHFSDENRYFHGSFFDLIVYAKYANPDTSCEQAYNKAFTFLFEELLGCRLTYQSITQNDIFADFYGYQVIDTDKLIDSMNPQIIDNINIHFKNVNKSIKDYINESTNIIKLFSLSKLKSSQRQLLKKNALHIFHRDFDMLTIEEKISLLSDKKKKQLVYLINIYKLIVSESLSTENLDNPFNNKYLALHEVIAKKLNIHRVDVTRYIKNLFLIGILRRVSNEFDLRTCSNYNTITHVQLVNIFLKEKKNDINIKLEKINDYLINSNIEFEYLSDSQIVDIFGLDSLYLIKDYFKVNKSIDFINKSYQYQLNKINSFYKANKNLIDIYNSTKLIKQLTDKKEYLIEAINKFNDLYQNKSLNKKNYNHYELTWNQVNNILNNDYNMNYMNLLNLLQKDLLISYNLESSLDDFTNTYKFLYKINQNSKNDSNNNFETNIHIQDNLLKLDKRRCI